MAKVDSISEEEILTMYAMQYKITLPADYDMRIIRERVATRGSALDGFPGLGLKAYLVREREVDGAEVNQYAPFYLWASIDGMNRFLWGGGGFGAIVESFGRPQVHHWTGIACMKGSARATAPSGASYQAELLPHDTDPAAIVEQARTRLQERARTPGVYATAIAVDPKQWELIHFTLWEKEVPVADEIRFQVLHLSIPHLDEIVSSI